MRGDSHISFLNAHNSTGKSLQLSTTKISNTAVSHYI